MRRIGLCLMFISFMTAAAAAGAAERNPVRMPPIQIGPEAGRIIVGFRTTRTNALTTTISSRMQAQSLRVVQAQTGPQDVAALAQRTGLDMARSRQLTPSMHVLFLRNRLYGAAALAALARLRADPAVLFASVDHRRYALAAPNDPLFPATSTTTCTPALGCTPAQAYDNGQWYMRAPPVAASAADNDLAATDALDAWAITTGSTGVVIADVDTGVLFDHPDLGRAGSGGRLLPGYDFVGQDYDPVNGAALGTYLIANDGDGWDPDPSDPGDWVSTTDFTIKDSQNNDLFPAATCGQPGTTPGTYVQTDSSWHGTRVSGVLGALTNNGAGIAGMTWGPWLLPVRALGKCGGYDSDIITGIEWAAGLPVAGVPTNPYPATIINLSLGGQVTTGCNNSATSANTCCPASYQSALASVTAAGALIVASAGNGGNPGSTAPVDAPANCSVVVPGVIAVAGLRNVGTKVGYSSSGPEVTVSAPAGNCVQNSGACLRSIDTTANDGKTVPGNNVYTDQNNPNLGTSFSAPIVAGVAALMRSVNANLTPAELAARISASATPFPANTANLHVCPASDPTTGECACPPTGQCGRGMVNALAAVDSALRPIAAVKLPASGSTIFDASGSAGSCGRTVVSYDWSATGGITLSQPTNLPSVSASGTSGTLTLVITDSNGATDTAIITFGSAGPVSTAPTFAGTSVTACPDPISITAAAPNVAISLAFAPGAVAINSASTFTITFANSAATDFTPTNFDLTLPSVLSISASPQVTTSCAG